MSHEIPPLEPNERRNKKASESSNEERSDLADGSVEQKINEEKFEADIEQQKPEAVERIADIPVKEVPGVDDKERDREILLKKEWLNVLVDSTRRIIAVFRSREADNFNPLIMPDKISQISGAINNLEDALHSNDMKLESLNAVFSKIASVIDSIGEVPRLANMKDDEESLRKVGFSLRAFEDENQTLASRIGKLEVDGHQTTLGLLKRIRASAQEKQLFVARRREALARYRGR